MIGPRAIRALGSALAAASVLLVAGCLSDGPSYFPYLLTGGPAVRTHAKPVGPGFFANFDPHAHRIEVRPEAITAPVRGTQVLIATIYDRDGKPRRKRRVEWIVEGPGSIVEVDESGWLPGRGMKIDNKYAYSHTDYFEHTITRGNEDPKDDFAIGPGQTWVAITSAVEGQTTVIAYAPEISDWDNNKVYVRVNWIDANMKYPPAATARAGGEYTFATKITRPGEGASGYRIRYRIIEGPTAALFSGREPPVGSVAETIAYVGEDGLAKVSIAQSTAIPGKNRIAIEVIKPNPEASGQFTVVSRGETTITWESPQLNVNVSAPRSTSPSQDVQVSYVVGGTAVETQAVMLSATIPEDLELIRTEPRASQDGATLIWSLPGLTPGQQHTVTATYRPRKLGLVNLAATARTPDGLSARGFQPLDVSDSSRLEVKLDGPAMGIVGESMPFQVTVTNASDMPANKVRLRARLDQGLEGPNKLDVLEQTIPTLAPGESKTVNLPVNASKAGKFLVQANATADGNLIAPPRTASITVQDAQLAVTLHGGGRAYVGQEMNWKLVVRNTGESSLGNIVLKANLPPEVTFVSATDGGEINGRQVIWNLGQAPARSDRSVGITVQCDRLVSKGVLAATVAANPVNVRDGVVRPVSMVKPLASHSAELPFEVIGVPALQVNVRDSDDPVGVGARTTYTVRVKNTGSLAANQVVLSALVPSNMRALRANGPGRSGKIDGDRIEYPAIESLAPGAESTFVVEVEGLVPGDSRFRAEVRSPVLKQPLRAEEPTRVVARTSSPVRP